ncbi:MAG: protein phosphatase 2C domain-containing protein [Bacteroidota bacterium]|nr:protein phosphatase 2C domain-containing protein [Bacteroidota bacterium]
MYNSDINVLKTKQLKSVDFYASSHVGCVREENQDVQDHFFGINGDLFIVCDGMGGTELGRKSAEIAVKVISEVILKEWAENPTEIIAEAIQKANEEVYRLTVEMQQSGGTTVALVLVRDVRLWYAHLGDSRIYYRSGRRFYCLTTDHSLVQELIEDKVITEEMAMSHPKRNVVTKALGLKSKAKPDILKEPIYPADKDMILLCTDGLTNELEDGEIHEFLSREQSTVEEKVKGLMNQTISFGARDNVSLQLLRFYNTLVRPEDTGVKKEKGCIEKFQLFNKVKAYFLYIVIISALIFGGYKYWINAGSQQKLNKGISTFVIYTSPDMQQKTDSVRLRIMVGPEDNLILYRDLFHTEEKELLDFNKIDRVYTIPGEYFVIPKAKQE